MNREELEAEAERIRARITNTLRADGVDTPEAHFEVIVGGGSGRHDIDVYAKSFALPRRRAEWFDDAYLTCFHPLPKQRGMGDQ